MAETANPALSKAHETVKVVVVGRSGRLLVPVQPDRNLAASPTAATWPRARWPAPRWSIRRRTRLPEPPAVVMIGDKTIPSVDTKKAGAQAGAQLAAFNKAIADTLTAVGYPAASNPSVVKMAHSMGHLPSAAVHRCADPVLPGHPGDDGLRPDRRGAGGTVPDADPLHLDVAALPYRQWLVRRPAAGNRVRHERADRQHLSTGCGIRS